jgi:hypothetical protein
VNAVLAEQLNPQLDLEERISQQMLTRGRLKENDLARARRIWKSPVAA